MTDPRREPSPGAVPAFLRATTSGVSLQVRVVPRASRNELAGALGTRLKVRIAAPPVDSAANDELVEFIAKRLGVPRGTVVLAGGHTSRNKTLTVEGISLAVASARLLSG